MVARNLRIITEGQPEIAHWCDKCLRTYPCDDGTVLKVEAVVTDGLTIGHPCCSVARCSDPLVNNRYRFCGVHDHLHKICAVEGCENPVLEVSSVVDGKTHTTAYKTCADSDHQEMERLNKEQGKANFQLSQKLMRQKVTHPNDAFAEGQMADLVDLEDTEQWFEVNGERRRKDGRVQMFSVNNPGATGVDEPSEEEICPTHPDTGNQKVKARFGRRRTHNEQVIIRLVVSSALVQHSLQLKQYQMFW